MKKILSLSIIVFVSIFLIGTTLVTAGDVGLTDGGKVPGKPFAELQKQIDELREQLDAMQLRENVEVYDFDDQFIGHLYGQTPDPVYIPELNAFAAFELDGTIRSVGWFYYSDLDCEGEISTRIDTFGESINYSLRQTSDKIAIFDPISSPATPKSYYQDYQCINRSLPYNEVMVHPGVEINVSEIPFNVPVAMPLRYK